MPRRPSFSPLIVANWKMQLGVDESHERLTDTKERLKAIKGRYQAVVCPCFISLAGAKKALRGSGIALGAQDVFWGDRGAFTGEVSPLNLREVGVEYVIIGHSERRHVMGETDDMVAQKMISAIGHGLTPILCVGESAHERNEGQHDVVVRRQLMTALRSTPPPSIDHRLYIAYEPVWAIGTGEPASADTAEAMRALIHQVLKERYTDEQIDQGIHVLYGGSVDPQNIADYVGPNAFHGALVGGASLQPDSFAQLITAIIDHS